MGTGSTKDFDDLLEKESPDTAPDFDVQRPVSSQEVNLLRWSDRTLLFSVRSDGGSASDQAKEIKAVRTRLWLHPVVAPEVLDLSGVDRTLGGSVRSLPPERPVSRKHAGSKLSILSLSVTLRGPPYNPIRRACF